MGDRCCISIITATMNVVATLPLTISSVRAQGVGDFEWLVVDGGSTDGTRELLGSNNQLLSWWQSAPDRGLYDAWNIACQHARGEWVIFLGAGDEFACAQTINSAARFLRELDERIDLAYGQQELLSENRRQPIELLGKPWAQLRDRWEIGRPALPPHGAVFQRRRTLLCAAPFDLRFPVAADSYFMLRLLRTPHAREPAFIPQVITRTPIGGVSLHIAGMQKISREIAEINRDLQIKAPWVHRFGQRLQGAGALLISRLPKGWRRVAQDMGRLMQGKRRRWTVG